MEGPGAPRLLCALAVGFAVLSNAAVTDDLDLDLSGWLTRLSSGPPFFPDPDRLDPVSASIHTQDFEFPRDPGEPPGAPQPGPLVRTRNGALRGVTVDVAHVFYGVPYAEPPVGAYRWKPPRPARPWRGIYDAGAPRASCMQGCGGPLADRCPHKVINSLSHLHVS